MKKTLVMSLALVLLAVGLGMQATQSKDRKAVERAVLDYVEGVYKVKPDYIKRSVHEDLAKFGFYREKAEDPYKMHPMTFEGLVSLAGNYNADGHIPDDAPKKVQILDLLDQTASVKLTAEWGIDYMHLAKYDGTWKIVQVLWQSEPMD